MTKKQITTTNKSDEINYCWEQKDGGSKDMEQISLHDILQNDNTIFLKNIKWIEIKDKELFPFYYVEIDSKEKVLVNYPYNQFDLKAFREGEYFYSNNKLFIKN